MAALAGLDKWYLQIWTAKYTEKMCNVFLQTAGVVGKPWSDSDCKHKIPEYNLISL